MCRKQLRYLEKSNLKVSELLEDETIEGIYVPLKEYGWSNIPDYLISKLCCIDSSF